MSLMNCKNKKRIWKIIYVANRWQEEPTYWKRWKRYDFYSTEKSMISF